MASSVAFHLNQNQNNSCSVNNRYIKYTTQAPSKKINEEGHKTEFTDNFVKSHLTLRKTIGALGILLPIILLVSSALFDNAILPSISHYYHSISKIIFTGILFITASFFWASKGENLLEEILLILASISAAMVAFFPTTNDRNILREGINYTKADLSQFELYSTPNQCFVGLIHYISATIFFASLILMVLFIFLPSEKKSPNSRPQHILIYKICGFGMAAFIFLIFLFKVLNVHWPFTFIFECLALILFGVAWWIKGNDFEQLRFGPKRSD